MKSLTQQLYQLACFSHIKQIFQINSGLSSISFKVQTQQDIYVAKYLGGIGQDENNHNNSIVNKEIYCNEFFAQHNLTPSVIYADQHWLVSNFISGGELNDSTLCLNDKLNVAVDLMQKLHCLKLELPVLNIVSVISQLLAQGTYQAPQINLINQIAEYLSLTINVAGNVICHGDINFSNILISNTATSSQAIKYYLIDFECACLADIEYDIAMLLAINNPDKAYYQAVVHMYESTYNNHGNNPKSINIDMVLVMRYLAFSHVIDGLWCYNKYEKNNDATMYQLALKQFSLFDQLDIFAVSLGEKMR